MATSQIRIGIGYDVHPFAEGRDLILGGERVPAPRGLMGHSDADVLVHAVIDALLGAAGLGDIGRLFPDSDESFRGISSIELLRRVHELLREKRITIVNIDAVVICERPKIAPLAERMKGRISAALGNLPVDRIGIKGKTTEGLGFTGREEGIAAQAAALVSLPG